MCHILQRSLWTKVVLSFLFVSTFAVELVPITDPEHIYGPRSVVRRDESPSSELDLLNVETFYWAAPAGNKMIYANFTVYFPEEYEHVISMERFADKLKSVQCADKMVLEFIDDEAFEYAKDVWNWVNQDVNNTFIMVTNYAGCIDDMERLPFLVSNIRYDEAANKAYLTTDLKDWEDVARSYTLKISNTPLTPMHRMLMARGVFPRDTDFSMSLVSGFDANLFSKTIGSWTTSVDAVVRTVGSLNVDFDVDVNWRLKLTSASIAITPENVAASIQLALTEKGTLNEGFAWQETILSIPIRGVEFLKKFKLGAFLDIDVGFTMDEWSGTAVANFGARMELSNAAVLKVDLVNAGNSQFSGWAPSFSPIAPSLSAKVEGSARVFAEPSIKLEASAFSKGWSVSLNLQMPYIEADFGAMYDTSGVCDSKKTIGVDVDTRVGVQLTAQAATKGNEANPFWEKELYERELDLVSKCFSFGENNAKPGEGVDPKPPKSKTKKPKTKAPKPTKKPKASPKPRSSKAPLTLKPSPNPKKPKQTPAKPSKAASSKVAKVTPSEEASSNVPQKSSPPDRTSSPPASKSLKPTPGKPDKSSKASSASSKASNKASSIATDESVQVPLPTSSNFQISSSSRSDETQKTSSRLSSASLQTSTLTVSTSTSFRNNTTRASGITTPPSTITAATLTTSSSLSTLDACPINGGGKGCTQCGKDDDDFPSEESSDLDLPPSISNRTARSLNRRWGSGSVMFTCDAGFTTRLKMASYPQLKDRGNPTVAVKVTDYYHAAQSTNCLNHQITHAPTAPMWQKGQPDRPLYQMEHIYEANWIPRFLKDLSRSSDLDCADIKRLFFTEKNTSIGVNTTWAQALMQSLGSTVNQDDLVFLWNDINRVKNVIFDDGDVIAKQRWEAHVWTAGKKVETHSPEWRINKIATIGRVMDYMAQGNIGKKLLMTVERVERTLDALVATLGEDDKAKAKNLGGIHRQWFNKNMSDRNKKLAGDMKRWASDASRSFTESTPKAAAASATGGLAQWESTTRFLDRLHTGKTGEFDEKDGTVGWYKW